MNWRRILLGALAAAAVAAAVFAALALAGATRRLDLVAYDLLFRIRGEKPGSAEIATVDIDDETVRALGRFPLDRRHYADLLRALSRDGCRPKAAAFDIFFTEPDAGRPGRRDLEDLRRMVLPADGAAPPSAEELRRRFDALLASPDEDIGRAAAEFGRAYFPAFFPETRGGRAALDRETAARRELALEALGKLKADRELYDRFLADPLGVRSELASRMGVPPGRIDRLTVRLIDREVAAQTRKLVELRSGGDLRAFVTGKLDGQFAGDLSPAALRWAKRLLLGEAKAEELWKAYDPTASRSLLAACAAKGQTYEKLIASQFADAALRARLASSRAAAAEPGLSARAVAAFDAEFPALPVLESARGIVTVQPHLEAGEGTVRSLPLLVEHEGQVYPSMGLAVALDALDVRLSDCRFEGGEFVIPAPGGERRVPVDRLGRALLNWNGGWLSSFRHVPLSKVLTGPPPGELDGRLVFVGLTATGTHDLNPTPFEERYPMVGANAELAEGILSDGFVREAGRGVLLALVLAAALVGALAGAALRRAWSPAAAAAGLGLICVGVYAAFATRQAFAPPAAPLGAFVLAYVGGVFWKYLVAEREGRHVKRAFAFRTSPALVEEMMRNPAALRLGGKRVEATIYLADLAGFTSVAESTAPEALVEVLNAHLSEISAAVIDAGGYVDKYPGDSVMAIFGAPVEGPGHARDACLAALAAQERIARLAERMTAAGGRPFRCRIGLNSGSIVAGNIGSRRRFDYTALGDAVNLASRLEGANKAYGTRILLSARTRELAGAGLLFRELGLARVVGRREPVQLFELLGREGEPQAAGRGEGLEVFAAGLRLFEAGDLAGARERFRRARELLGGGDGPAELLAGRCEALIAAGGPPPGWSGVLELESK